MPWCSQLQGATIDGRHCLNLRQSGRVACAGLLSFWGADIGLHNIQQMMLMCPACHQAKENYWPQCTSQFGGHGETLGTRNGQLLSSPDLGTQPWILFIPSPDICSDTRALFIDFWREEMCEKLGKFWQKTLCVVLFLVMYFTCAIILLCEYDSECRNYIIIQDFYIVFLHIALIWRSSADNVLTCTTQTVGELLQTFRNWSSITELHRQRGVIMSSCF